MPNVNVDVNLPDVDGWLGVLNGYAEDASSNANSLANSLVHNHSVLQANHLYLVF